MSLVQLRALGVGTRAVEGRLRAGRLHRVHRGVYAVGHPLLTIEGRWTAAVLACGDGALLSHRDAAAALDLRPCSAAAIEVTVPRAGGRERRPGIVVHRSVTLRPSDVDSHRGIPVTSVARTLFDLADVITAGRVERAVERAEGLRIFDLGELRAVIAGNPTRRGCTGLSRILEQYRPDPGLPRRGLEEHFLDICAAHGIPRPAVNAPVGPNQVDFLWRTHRLIVETDGHETHGTRAAFERDRARDAWLAAAGYRVVRFTYRQVAREPGRVTRLLRALLA